MAAYKLSDWNDLLDAVNNVLQNPPDGCDPIDPIPPVEAPHRWSKDDIREVHDKLIETCSSITFDEIPELWKQSIPDEINEKLGEAWCDCEEDCGDPNDEHGTEIEIRHLDPQVYSNCFGHSSADNIEPICPVIGGMEIGRPGVNNRQWRLIRRFSNGSQTNVASGSIDCDGKVVCLGSDTMTKQWGVFISCPNCESSSCQLALANAETTVSTMSSITYVLRIISTLGECCE